MLAKDFGQLEDSALLLDVYGNNNCNLRQSCAGKPSFYRYYFSPVFYEHIFCTG